VVKNKFTEEWAHREQEAAAAFGSLAGAFAEARSSQNFDVAPVVAGESVGLFHDRPPAANIIESMVAEAGKLLGRGATLDFR
jgi:nitronate monooxygenase